MPKPTVAIKRILIGRPRVSGELSHQLLPKWMALPVFSSDPLSSVAYATQEMMLVLALAGAGAFGLVPWLSLGVATLLSIVVVSYRQTVRAYPHGGGAYIVARENLGDRAGLHAAGALLIDYTLTVAVSIAAGVAALVSAAPSLAGSRVTLALGFVALVTFANLRGVREAGALFALPTYAFIAVMLTLVGTGVTRCLFAACPQVPAGAAPELETAGALTLFLVLRAFSSGATALTGVEAISNGVPAFRYPQSRNAARTLAIMGVIAVTLFLGISFLATHTGVMVAEEMERTVVAQIALAVFGQGAGFYLVQVVTAAILVLAANTAYADFPRLASVLARDRFVPRQFVARGDRLVFSNGILALALAATLLLVVYQADVNQLVQLYVVGVFTAFTLSQAGMVRHWLRVREAGWRQSIAINAVGATVTAVVLVVVSVTKFAGGAWIVLLGIPSLALLMARVKAHYARVSLHLRAGVAEPEPPRPNHVLILMDRVDESAARALSYAYAVRAASVTAIAVPADGADIERRWAALAPAVPLEVLRSADSRGVVRAVRESVRAHADRRPGAFTTAIVAETLSASWLDQVLHHRLALRLKATLLGEGGLVVTDLVSPDAGPGPYRLEEPVEHHVVVLVSAVHRATTRALAYAEGLHATSIRALCVDLGLERSSHLLQEWQDWGLQTPLEIVDSPFRSMTETVRRYVRDLEPDGRERVVTCVIPEFVLPHWYEQPLHNQTALIVKAALLFERGVVTVSVPYRLPAAREAPQPVRA